MQTRLVFRMPLLQLRPLSMLLLKGMSYIYPRERINGARNCPSTQPNQTGQYVAQVIVQSSISQVLQHLDILVGAIPTFGLNQPVATLSRPQPTVFAKARPL